MGGLAPTDHKTLEKLVLRLGCTFVRQEGSHRVYWRVDLVRPITIPTYRQVPIFIIRNILRQLQLSVDDYLRLKTEL